MLRRSWLLLAAVAAVAPAARADVKVHPIFSDNMVVQRDMDMAVWGTADAGEEVAVSLDDHKVSVTADKDGKWLAKLQQPKVDGKAHTLTVKGKNTVTFKNVAIGDVWVCSGQSNMEWRLSGLNKDDPAKNVTKDQGKEVAAKAANPNIRLFTVQKATSHEPLATVQVNEKAQEGMWFECKPETAINFSAVGYFFGRDIEASQKVPVGLISTNWGGTICEAWASKEALNAVPELKYFHENMEKAAKGFDAAKADDDFKKAIVKYDADMSKWKEAADKAKEEKKPAPRQPQKPVKATPLPGGPNVPSVLFNGMINPITKFKIKGALWYQGESNAGRAAEYYTLFPTMISDWRKRWGYDFPFFVVQLAPFQNGNSAAAQYAEVRDAQFQASKKLKHVGYATLSDIGNETDIHPQAKEPVGQRLALAARAIAYGEKVEWSGPVYKGMKADGSKVVLTFDHVGKGLTCTGDKLEGFTVCGEDKKFVPAEAKIVGDTVEVSAKGVDKPVAVRFGWVNFAKPDLNFANKDGLPAVPFRTDDFPLTTIKK